MRQGPTRILFLLLFFSLAGAVNFTQCLEDFRDNPEAIGGVDSQGHPTSSAVAVGLTYKACKALCGGGAESFDWRDFAQLFSTWLLPWLALISQLPFSSENYDNFISVVLSVGSPALAAYSLALTALNVRLVCRKARSIEHKSTNVVARVLITLQQASLQLTQDPRLLAFIPDTDRWGRGIVDRLAWSITTGSSVAWVVISFVFTLVDSFVSLGTGDAAGIVSEGHAIGTLWLWLLCLVIGWLWVPAFTGVEVKSAIGHANSEVATRRTRQRAARAYRLARTRILKKPAADPAHVEPDEDNGAESIKEDTKSVGRGTEPDAKPLPNPPHYLSTLSPWPPTKGQHSHLNISAKSSVNHSAASLAHTASVFSVAVQSSINPETDGLLVLKDLGPLNRDELRLPATFNYSRIMRYFALVDDVFGTLNDLPREKDHVSEVTAGPEGGAVFPRGALISMFKASIPALILQCGTTAAAAIIIVFTPTIGLGCRSLGYIIYGGIAVLILFLTIISTILARISETGPQGPPTRYSVIAVTSFAAIALRRISLLLAFINAMGLIVLSCFQFSHFLDNCYCNASVTGRGTGSAIIISIDGWIPTMRTTRIVASALSSASAVIYMTFLWRMSTLPPELSCL